MLSLTACGSSEQYDETTSIDKNLLYGTWESTDDVEKVTLTLNEDKTFSFSGTGFGSDSEEEVVLTETGNYEIDGNRLVLNIEDVQSTGLKYEDFTSEDLGSLEFYIQLEDSNNTLELTETTGTNYILTKVFD